MGDDKQMKFFSIDEDVLNTLIDLMSDAWVVCEEQGDRSSSMLYKYLLDELEHAKVIKDLPDMSSTEKVRMKKLERYLRMLQEGLKNPNDVDENEKRRKFARDNIIEPRNMQDKLRIALNDDTQRKKLRKALEEWDNNHKPKTRYEILEEQFEEYYQKREEKKQEAELNKMLKKLKIGKNKGDNRTS